MRDNFLLFFFSVLFGKVMEETGAAASIAKFLAELLGEKFAILGVIFSGAVLVYGGVTTLVVVFSLASHCPLPCSREANLPRYLLPGAIAGGCFTFACANFPGTPNLVNVIPTTYLGTNTMAAPLVGVITGIAVMLMVCVYFLWEASRARARGDCFVEDEATTQSLVKAASMVRLPSPIIAILPIVLILILLNVFKQHVVVAMLGGILLCVVLFFRNVHGVLDMFSYSAENSAIAIINTAVVVGFGSVVQASQGFQKLLDFATSLENILPPAGRRPPMTTILAGACGSGSGGLGIALSAMADKYTSWAWPRRILHQVGSRRLRWPGRSAP
ncbi:MAG: GntP family permease [Oscillospiraceae bacterium]